MSSLDQTTSLPDPLPAHLKAMLELNRDAQAGAWRHDWHLFMMLFVLLGMFVFVMSRSHDWGSFLPAWGVLCLSILLIGQQRAAERRAQRRLQLLLTVIRGLERREDAAARS